MCTLCHIQHLKSQLIPTILGGIWVLLTSPAFTAHPQMPPRRQQAAVLNIAILLVKVFPECYWERSPRI